MKSKSERLDLLLIALKADHSTPTNFDEALSFIKTKLNEIELKELPEKYHGDFDKRIIISGYDNTSVWKDHGNMRRWVGTNHSVEIYSNGNIKILTIKPNSVWFQKP